MHGKSPAPVLIGIAVLAAAALACNAFVNAIANPSPVPPPTLAPMPLIPATLPVQPAVEESLIPPSTAGATVTSESDESTEARDYFRRGLLPYENGELTALDDFSSAAQSAHVVQLTRTGERVKDFALWADIELHTIGETTYPDYTGCGFAYRIQGYEEGYTAILTNDYARVGACSSGFLLCDLFGTAYGIGTGKVDVPNDTKAEFSMAVNGNRLLVNVNGAEVGQYTLYETRLTGTGELAYAAVSNINGGYWTSCKITNVRLWKSQP